MVNREDRSAVIQIGIIILVFIVVGVSLAWVGVLLAAGLRSVLGFLRLVAACKRHGPLLALFCHER